MEIRRYTSGYTSALRHFVIQNIGAGEAPSEFRGILKTAKNILQRGQPTPLPDQLRRALELEGVDLQTAVPPKVLPADDPVWHSTILGDSEHGHNPAKRFLEALLPAAAGQGVGWLLEPEVLVDDLIQESLDDLCEQQVDFYVPDARLVVEIDGPQHEEWTQATKDRRRTMRLKQYGISTIRIPTTTINASKPLPPELIDALKKARDQYISQGSLTETQTLALRAVAAFRLQLAILELLLNGMLPINDRPWRLTVRCMEARDFAIAAVDDLERLLKELADICEVPWPVPRAEVREVTELLHESAEWVQIHLSCYRRWTDEDLLQRNTIIVRSDYRTEYPDSRGVWRALDRFRVECDQPFEIKLKDISDSTALGPCLERIFGLSSFRAGQLKVIDNVLRRRKTIGVLPTGHGKSLCYQFPAMLQPGVTIVISPLRSLMRDQVAELAATGIHRVAAISSDDTAQDKAAKVQQLARGQLQILLVSPERLQIAAFRDACSQLMRDGAVHHAVVDEVHCLSEWGHDFRVAYLNLSRTLERHFPRAPFLGLTATASANVLTDIRNEFSVEEDDVIYRLDIRRDNLSFKVAPAGGSHTETIAKLISQYLSDATSSSGSGIVFTPHVNGHRGCAPLADKLSRALNWQVDFFAGQQPKTWPGTREQFEQRKLAVQDAFKTGALKLLCATKAFGMGVNKKDVRFTIHLGVPSSMEALYQEAGRAGRDGAAAECVVVASPADPQLEAAFGRDIKPSELIALVDKSSLDSDLKAQLWLITKELRTIKDEFRVTGEVLRALREHKDAPCQISASDIKLREGASAESAFAVQMAIYRLSQLGYVADWTVANFFKGDYVVDFREAARGEPSERLVSLVRKYEGQSQVRSISDICDGDESLRTVITSNPQWPEEHTSILVLLYWSYTHFNYNRRQSLKTVFQLCADYDTLGAINFRRRLEDFFQVDLRTTRVQRFIDGGIGLSGEWLELLFAGQLASGSSSDQTAFDVHLGQLQSMISRLLESYRSNLCLDLLSAAVRLLRDQYDDLDGRGRVQSQLRDSRLTDSDRQAVITFLLRVGSRAGANAREQLAADVLSHGSNRMTARRVHEALQDDVSLATYLEQFGRDLENQYSRCVSGLTA